MDKRLSDDDRDDVISRTSAETRPPARRRVRIPTDILICFLIGAVAHVALWQISEPPTLFSDFYKAYYPAAEVLWYNGRAAVWPLTEPGAGGFVNVPIVAWLFVPLVPLGEDAAGWVFLGVGLVVTALAYLVLMAAARPAPRLRGPLLLLFLLNGPLINSLREGNTTHFVLLLLGVALILLRGGREYAAGIVLGLSAIIKLPLLLYAAYFLLRRRWFVLAGGATTIIGTALLSVAAFGLKGNVDWFDCCVEPFIGGILPAFNVQSIDGFALRLVTGTSRLMDWDPMDPPGLYKFARFAIFAALVGGVVLVMQRAQRSCAASGYPRHASVNETLEYAIVVVLALVLSPISWSHYYLLMLMPWCLYFGGQISVPSDAAVRRLVWASIVLASLPVVVLPLGATFWGEVAARTIVSAWFFGGIALLLALLRSLWSTAKLPASARDRPC